MSPRLALLLGLAAPCAALLLSPLPSVSKPLSRRAALRNAPLLCAEGGEGELVASGDVVVDGATTKLTAAEVEQVGNLAADDEWLGLAMELGIVMRSAIRESVKGSVREFTGKDDYKLGDISKEADMRIKDAIADMRGKEEYELGDLAATIDQIAKDEVRTKWCTASLLSCNIRNHPSRKDSPIRVRRL